MAALARGNQPSDAAALGGITERQFWREYVQGRDDAEAGRETDAAAFDRAAAEAEATFADELVSRAGAEDSTKVVLAALQARNASWGKREEYERRKQQQDWPVTVEEAAAELRLSKGGVYSLLRDELIWGTKVPHEGNPRSLRWEIDSASVEAELKRRAEHRPRPGAELQPPRPVLVQLPDVGEAIRSGELASRDADDVAAWVKRKRLEALAAQEAADVAEAERIAADVAARGSGARSGSRPFPSRRKTRKMRACVSPSPRSALPYC